MDGRQLSTAATGIADRAQMVLGFRDALFQGQTRAGYFAGDGMRSSAIAACQAKVAMNTADCFNSSSLMRSG
jgi:hypothetical protein